MVQRYGNYKLKKETRSHTHTHARTHARTQARTHAHKESDRGEREGLIIIIIIESLLIHTQIGYNGNKSVTLK